MSARGPSTTAGLPRHALIMIVDHNIEIFFVYKIERVRLNYKAMKKEGARSATTLAR